MLLQELVCMNLKRCINSILSHKRDISPSQRSVRVEILGRTCRYSILQSWPCCNECMLVGTRRRFYHFKFSTVVIIKLRPAQTYTPGRRSAASKLANQEFQWTCDLVISLIIEPQRINYKFFTQMRSKGECSFS